MLTRFISFYIAILLLTPASQCLYAAVISSAPKSLGEFIDAPAYINAKPGDNAVELVWAPVKSALSYTIQRSDNPGGPYKVIQQNIPLNHWTDTDVINDHCYYYTVFAKGVSTSGGTSVEVPATPRVIEGIYPSSQLNMGKDGWLYGVTSEGGRFNNGTIFRFNPDGAFETIHHFTAKQIPDAGSPVLYPGNADGANPCGSLVFDNNGVGYGTTTTGGANDLGTIYQLLPGSRVIPLRHLGLSKRQEYTEITHNADGARSLCELVIDKDDKLYGLTSTGGKNGTGTIFVISRELSDKQKSLISQKPGANIKPLSYNTYRILHSFTDVNVIDGSNKDGAEPATSLIQCATGALYGTTPRGGQYGGGVIFCITPAGAYTTLYHFPSHLATLPLEKPIVNLSSPAGSLLEGSDHKLYGICSNGGDNDCGAVYSLTPEGALSIIYSFDKHASCPLSGLSLLKRDIRYDVFIGVTSQGGDNNAGIVFTLQSNGVFNALCSLPTHCRIRNKLTVMPDGTCYGVSPDGGENGHGCIVQIDRKGCLTIVRSFK